MRALIEETLLMIERVRKKKEQEIPTPSRIQTHDLVSYRSTTTFPNGEWNLKKLLNSIEIEVDGPGRGERNEQCSK